MNKNKKKEYLISVLTPTWDRAEYLPRVWQGLNNQTYKNFEWIIINDGSKDDTINVIKNLSLKSNFQIKLINASCRLGKSRADNEGIKLANGEFILWCDSDDLLLPDALDMLLNTWISIPNNSDDYLGVTALCRTNKGILGNKFYNNNDTIDIIWEELYSKLKSDHIMFIKSSLLKKNLFQTVDFLIPESSVWSLIGIMKTRFLPIALMEKNYYQKNALSFTGLMSYNKGNALGMAITKNYIFPYKSLPSKVFFILNYLRYCHHGDINISNAIKLWKPKLIDYFYLFLLLPLAKVVAFKDIVQGKVRKTHIEYEKNASVGTYELIVFNTTIL